MAYVVAGWTVAGVVQECCRLHDEAQLKLGDAKLSRLRLPRLIATATASYCGLERLVVPLEMILKSK